MSHKRQLLIESTDKDMDKVLESVSVKIRKSVRKVNAIHKARLAEINKKQENNARTAMHG